MQNNMNLEKVTVSNNLFNRICIIRAHKIVQHINGTYNNTTYYKSIYFGMVPDIIVKWIAVLWFKKFIYNL